MTVFELARLPRTVLIAEFLATRGAEDILLDVVSGMSRDHLVAAILDARDR